MDQRKYPQEKEQLHQLEKDTLQRGRIFPFIFLVFIMIDQLGRNISSLAFPRLEGLSESDPLFREQEDNYFELILFFDSLEKFMIAGVFYLLVSSRLKINFTPFVVWMIGSWFSLRSADLIDQVTGNRSEFTVFDIISLIVIGSSLLVVISKHFNLFRKRFRLFYRKH